MLNTPASGIRFPRLLLTGAGGNLGKELRPRLKKFNWPHWKTKTR